MGQRQIILDSVIAAALVVALLAVYLYDGNSRKDGPVAEETPAPVSRRMRIAVTTDAKVYDDVGRLLDDLGEGYKYTTIQLRDIQDYRKIADYDILFLACGTQPKSWLGKEIGDGSRNATRYTWNEDVIRELQSSLHRFLEKGGIIYASDWQFAVLDAVFPDYVNGAKRAAGDAQMVEASIVDPGLSEVIGRDKLMLKFDLSDWRPAALIAPRMRTYLEGNYRGMDGLSHVAPLLVKFPYGEGQVFFTSFHNERQNNKDEMKLLRYLVFAAMTARLETNVTSTLVKGGFSPSKQSLLSVGDGSQSVTQTYANKKPGKLLFVLAFAAEGAELELTVKDPDGNVSTRKGSSTLQINLDNAKTGDYEYKVTSLKVPYPNFPFALTIANEVK